MENFLDKIIFDNINKRGLLLLEDKVKYFLEEKSILLKENPLQWEKNCSVEFSICPFSKKIFTIESNETKKDNPYTLGTYDAWRTTLKVDNQLIFEETVSTINIDKFKKLAEKLR